MTEDPMPTTYKSIEPFHCLLSLKNKTTEMSVCFNICYKTDAPDRYFHADYHVVFVALDTRQCRLGTYPSSLATINLLNLQLPRL